MKNILGNVITLTVFGESHGPCIGGVLDGLPAGLPVDMDYIMKEMDKRRSIASISTPRREADVPEFLSGVRNGYTEGTAVAFIIRNGNVHSSDYDNLSSIARPGHADYASEMKYGGYQDPRGGGHFSGRLTAVIVAAGAIVRQALEARGIVIATHLSEAAGVKDEPASLLNYSAGKSAAVSADLKEIASSLNSKSLAAVSDEAGERMVDAIRAAQADGDSVGGILETVILGLEPGIGEPLFGSIESEIAGAVFSIGGVKGVEFGAGFGISGMRGSEANDAFRMKDGIPVTLTNNNGGINGGISNGMPIVFRTAVKPTPSISIEQRTINFEAMEDTDLSITGRHDPAIVHRARAVVDAITALVIADLICQRCGYQYLIST